MERKFDTVNEVKAKEPIPHEALQLRDEKFSIDHVWLRAIGDDLFTVGITPYAQDSLGDIVYVQLPEPGMEIQAGDEAAVIESVKAASALVMPVTGMVIEVNQLLNDEPQRVNEDPMGEGWFFTVHVRQPADLDTLMDGMQYRRLTGQAS